MMSKHDKKRTGKHRTWGCWLIAGLLLLCFIPAFSLADTVSGIQIQKAELLVKETLNTGWILPYRPFCGDTPTITTSDNLDGIKPNKATSITFIVSNKSGPLQNADVTITSTGGSLTKTSGKTIAGGKFSTQFTSNKVGDFLVCATASSSSVCEATVSFPVSVSHTKPVADIIATPVSPAGPNPLTVTFDAAGSSAADGATITGFAWQFSDGGTGTTQKVSHTFQKADTYTISLEVTDSFGEKSFPKLSKTYVVTVRESLTVMNLSDIGPVKEKDPADFQIKVTTKDGKGLANANVSVTSLNPSIGSVSPESRKTDASGVAIFTFNALKAGNTTLAVTADDPTYVSGTREIKVQVNPPDSPLPIILIAIGILILLIIVIILAWLWTRSTFVLKPKVKEIPADGRSTVPIRIQFTNGFGSLKKQGSDREIHLETTAGAIQDMMIPAGKEYAEATLTASREVGLVTVTATTEDKARATAEVRFTGEEAGVEVQITPPEIPADGISTATIILRVRDRNGAFLTYLDEKVIGLTATMGTVPATVRIEPRAPSGNATIVSSDKTGTALVRARTGAVAGEGSVIFRGLAQRFCMHCGVKMAMEASFCPNCGKIPPSGVDTKQCSTCNAVLPQPAGYCDKCGARQPQ